MINALYIFNTCTALVAAITFALARNFDAMAWAIIALVHALNLCLTRFRP